MGGAGNASPDFFLDPIRCGGMIGWLLNLLGFAGKGYGPDELARRLDVPLERLEAVQPKYREFTIPKRSGGRRRITAPDKKLKQLQRRILRRLLARLRSHPGATGFERGQSFVTNAGRHQGQAIVIRFDIVDFFPSISEERVKKYFRRIGWNRKATRLLVRLVTWQGSLPQGAPTSPRLSNLVNYRLDSRISVLAKHFDAVYTRYADDITLSLPTDQCNIRPLIGGVMAILRDEGYVAHQRKKFSVLRRHHRQKVTGLVVNDRVQLPRQTRRWLRAVEDRARHYWPEAGTMSSSEDWRPLKYPTITKPQLDGWRALVQMIEQQGQPRDEAD